MATATKTTASCGRCNGLGHIKSYNHVQGGICFKCAGAGVVEVAKKRQPSKAALERKAQKEAERQAYIVENERKTKIALQMYADDPRMERWNDIENKTYMFVDAQNLAKKDGVWNTL